MMQQITTPIYNSFEDLCVNETSYDIPEWLSIEYEVMAMLIGGRSEYQQLILDHTNENMFFDKNLKNIYILSRLCVDAFGIKKLNKTDLILNLERNGGLPNSRKELITYLHKHSEQYEKQIQRLDYECTCSANAANWIEKLHTSYLNKSEAMKVSYEEHARIIAELEELKINNTETGLGEIAVKFSNSLDDRSRNIIKTCYPSIDKLIGGLQGGNLMILAGATGMGKTAMALNIVLRMAKAGRKILLFSLEMKPEELFIRIASMETLINSETYRKGGLTEAEAGKYYSYIGSYSFEKLKTQISIHNKSSVSISQIESIVRKSNADIVCIDYLGLISGDRKTNTYEEISDVSRRLKLLANDSNKPFIVLHQLNRDAKNRTDKRPTLSDIRDSGKIEQDADFITFVYRPSYYDNTKDKNSMEFIIGKSRHSGGAGKIANLIFNGDTQLIKDTRII